MHLSKAQAKAMGILPGAVGVKINPYAPFKSKLEMDYHAYLNFVYAPNAEPDVKVWYEAVTFTLVPASEHQKGVRYTPDFTIWRGCEIIEVIECKGFWREGAKEKVKALAHRIRPVPIYVVRKVAGEWTKERF